MQLSIIIVNFNVKYFLEQCLCSVSMACRNIEAEVFVVDNNSSDGSKDFFAGRFDAVKFIWSQENVGFSKANNLALAEAIGQYILFLNPDTILPEDCLEKTLAFFEDKKDMGAMGIRMIDGSGNFLKESKRAFPSLFTSFCKLSGLTSLFPSSRIFGRYYLGELDENKNHRVDVLAGAFMLIRKSILDKIGGFDERFFLYGEDVDLSYRIQQAGFQNVYFSESTMIHFKGESTNRGSLKYVRLFYGAMSLFVKKHYSSGLARFYNLLIRVAIWIKALFSAIAHMLKRMFGKVKPGTVEARCLIIAGETEFDFIRSVLQENNRQQEIIGRINPGSAVTGDAMGSLQQLSGLVVKENATEIIFCTDDFSTKEAISIIQQLKEEIFFRFHFAGTFSIVGSKYEKSAGDFIAISRTT
ncbi:MAG: glycosyltransferase family 2 protein [Ferruginibacter sp.]